MLALCLDAADDYDTARRLEGLTSGAYQVVWAGPGFARGYDNRPASELIRCLAHQAKSYDLVGLGISANDCWWLIAHLKAETLTVTGGPL